MPDEAMQANTNYATAVETALACINGGGDPAYTLNIDNIGKGWGLTVDELASALYEAMRSPLRDRRNGAQPCLDDEKLTRTRSLHEEFTKATPQPTESELIQTMRLLDATRRELDDAEDVVKQIQERRRELEDKLLEQTKHLGLTGLPRVAGLGTFTLAKRHSFKADPAAIREYLKSQSLDELLTCNYQTWQAHCKELLSQASVLPDGTEVVGVLPEWIQQTTIDEVRWSARAK